MSEHTCDRIPHQSLCMACQELSILRDKCAKALEERDAALAEKEQWRSKYYEERRINVEIGERLERWESDYND